MRSEINLLILDEPTNHLDIASREWIEDAVEEYDEALLFVSHDRYFIQEFATRIWALEDGRLTDFRGDLAAYNEYKSRQLSLQQTAKAVERKKEKPQRRKSPGSIEKQIARLERDIARAEEALAAIDRELEANATDYEKLMELGEKRSQAEEQLDALYLEWEELSENE